MTVTFHFNKTKTGYTSSCDFMEMSIHKGIKGFGKTQANSINSLIKKWNRKAEKSFQELSKISNIKVKKYSLNLESITNK